MPRRAPPRTHSGLSLADVAFTLQVGRKPFAHRRFVVARDAMDAATVLAARNPARIFTAEAAPDRLVAFLFPGLGDLRFQGATDLYRHLGVFRAAFDTCAERLLPLTGEDVHALLAAPSEDRFRRWVAGEKEAASPLASPSPRCCARMGPLHLVVGRRRTARYSLGEYMAATAAGVFSWDDALALVAERARLIEELPPGAMTAVGLAADEVTAVGSPGIYIAASNGETLCVAAGTPEAVSVLEGLLGARGAAYRRSDARHAFHTPWMRPAAEHFAATVERVRRAPPHTSLFSTVSGTLHDGVAITRAGYWCEHMVSKVNFALSSTRWRRPRPPSWSR